VELTGVIHLNSAELAIKQDDLTTAQTCCRHALKMFGRTGDENGIAETYKFLGCIYARRKKWQQAERVFQRSIQIFEECQNPLNAAEVRYEYGLMCIEQGRKEVAKWELNWALNIFSELQAISDVQKVKAALEKVK
jgi:tetratricopeptide (TPR) repeat protein